MRASRGLEDLSAPSRSTGFAPPELERVMLSFNGGPQVGEPHEAARVHHAPRRRGGRRGRSRRARSRRARAAHRRAHEHCRGRSRWRRLASRRLCRGCSNWAGPTAATCGSTPAGPQAMPSALRRYAAELVALAPDVDPGRRQRGRGATAPSDPHRADRVRAGPRSSRRRLCRQLGAARRQRHRLYAAFEYGMSAKWLELLKEIAPRVTRAAVLRDPAIASGSGQFGAIQAVAPSFGRGVEPGRRARRG